ncbi:MAG: DNA internalization-related competence protein ComEC/Rec2 [Coriobacteriia bacterium]|nr:DNA internalization-related competence protein ComEC/Rec2 [Coriobacteriia bacterium]
MPLRPSLPPLGWAAAAAWCGVAAAQKATATPILGGGHSTVWALVLAVCLAFAVGGLLVRRRKTLAALIVFAFAASAATAAFYWMDLDTKALELTQSANTHWTIEVLSDASTGRFGSSSEATILSPTGMGAVVSINWPQDSAVPELGSRVEVTGGITAPSPEDRASGVAGSLRAKAVSTAGWAESARGIVGPLRQWACRQVALVPGPGGDLLAGVVLGDRRRLSGTDANTDFRTTGLTHLVAVSGSHLVVVAAVIGWVLGALGVGRVMRSASIAVLLGGYVVLSGVQPSAIRAWVMAVVVSTAWLSGRRVDGGSALAAAVMGILVLSPTSAFDLGFRLSVAAVAGLVLFAGLGEAWIAAGLPRMVRSLAGPASLTLAATATTAPMTVPVFGMLSLVSPLANLLVGPIVSLVLVVGLVGLAVSAVVAPLGGMVLHAAGAAGACATWVAAVLARMPHAAVALAFPLEATALLLAAALLVWGIWPRPTRRRATVLLGILALGIVLLAAGPRIGAEPEIVVLDVGQGDAILVRDGSHSLLVDTGPSASQLRLALARENVRTLDGVIITHLHDDHYGGLSALEGLVSVPYVAMPAGSLKSTSPAIDEARALAGTNVRELSAGDKITVGKFELVVVWPSGPVKDAATNEASVVLLVWSGTHSALLTGDAEEDVLREIISKKLVDGIDTLKVGHHGSAGAVDSEVMSALHPKTALISVGTGNRFGHPVATTLQALVQGGAMVFRTDQVGDVTARFTDDGVVITGARRLAAAMQPIQVAQERGLVGTSSLRCATLLSTIAEWDMAAAIRWEKNVQGLVRPQTGLPDIRERAPPPRAGYCSA